jgi:hypothetical protein
MRRRPAAAHNSTANQTPVPDATKPKAVEGAAKLTEMDKRAYAPGVELGLDVAKEGTELNRARRMA